MLRTVRDWVFSVPFLIAFGLTLGVHDIAGRIARLFGMRPFEYVMASLQRTLMATFRIAGVRFEIDVDPSVEPHRGYAVISNHQSLLDIAMIGGLLFTNFPKYVAKKELGRWIPSISLNLKYGGNALIDRSDPRQSIRSIVEMAKEAQRRGVSVVIFPEGTRSRDGSVGEFKRSGSRAMLSAADELPVVPAAVDGCWELLEHNLMPVPFGTTVRLRIGAPIVRTPGDSAEVADAAEAWIRETIAGWRD